MKTPSLLLTHSGDFYTIDRVEEGLDRRGAPHLRVNTDQFPASFQLVVTASAHGFITTLDFGSYAFDLETVPAIWSRRIWPGGMPASMDPRWVAHCRTACRTGFIDALLGLSRPYWINPLAAATRAESKLLQLKIAGQVGLRVPDTLVTNDPARARSFFDEHRGGIVTKLLDPLSQTMDGSGDFVYTSVVRAEDLEALGDLKWAPQIFQPLVPKRRELRVIFVGDRCFAGAIDVSGSDRASIDWRRATRADALKWVDAKLPPSVEARCRTLLSRLGLVYGALDFIETTEGEPVFLEVNPAGEWGWLERDLGHPIGDSLAEALVVGSAK